MSKSCQKLIKNFTSGSGEVQLCKVLGSKEYRDISFDHCQHHPILLVIFFFCTAHELPRKKLNFYLKMGDSRKYPYPTTGGIFI